MKIAALSLLLTACVAGQAADASPSRAAEAALKKRVERFYTLVAAKKYREAEALVAPSSRDAWYSSEKPLILDFHISGVQFIDHNKAAEVSLDSHTMLRRAVIGEFKADLPFTSHWKYEAGNWWWYVPNISERKTPFGVMHTNPETAATSGVDLKKMIGTGPRAEQLAKGVLANADQVALGPEPNASYGVILQNMLNGPVEIATSIPPESGLIATATKTTMAKGEKITVIVRRTAPSAKAAALTITVQPTGQIIVLPVRPRQAIPGV